ncbi:phosphatidylserine decarboxylase [Gordonia aichiensis]|uniref:phosphatidylserine decarboxylase n=1 Tax=Gordonia aichiensis TaxID=36820 RepID=UPI0003451175
MARRPRPDASAQHPATASDGPIRSGLTPAHLVALARETLPPIHPAGLPFVAAASAVALAGRRHRWVAVPATAAAGACAAFFRHPSRVPPTEEGVVVAPADGIVSLVDDAVPPAESGLGERPRPRVSTFLSIFDVHVQRVPISGRVVSVTHTPGRFVSADLPEASSANERTTMVVRPEGDDDPDPTPRESDIAVVQIAGLLARRIVCTAKVGDHLTIGDTYGLIRFGSRVDVYLPPGTPQRVSVGQRTVGAETPLATLRVRNPTRTGDGG